MATMTNELFERPQMLHGRVPGRRKGRPISGRKEAFVRKGGVERALGESKAKVDEKRMFF